MLSNPPNDLARFHFECVHFTEAANEYVNRVHGLLNEMAEAYGDDDYGLYTSTIPTLHNSSTIIYLYSILEQQFNEAARIVKNIKELELGFNKFQGQGIQRSKIYLQDYAKVKISLTDEDWRHVTMIGLLRNSLAHGGGLPKDSPNYKPLEQYRIETDRFSIDDTGIYVDRTTVDFVLNKITISLERLGESIFALGNDEKYRLRF